MKNMLMIEYLTNLLNLVYMKINGKQINSSDCILRLAELRCIIEKTKSIEFKLKYQIFLIFFSLSSNIPLDIL